MRRVLCLVLLFCFSFIHVSSYDGPLYDSSAYTECKLQYEEPLYGGGILKDQQPKLKKIVQNNGDHVAAFHSHSKTSTLSIASPVESITCFYCLSFAKSVCEYEISCVNSLDQDKECRFSSDEGVSSNRNSHRDSEKGCWSFLKGGGFVLSSPSNLSTLYIKVRKSAVTIHVSDQRGVPNQGASIRVKQVYKDFPFGSAIAESIIGNSVYQKWFIERFDAAVFENELKWNATEHIRGQVDYGVPDRMMEFVRSNQIVARGHNIFWENPKYAPPWVLNLNTSELESAIESRIQSLMNKYGETFINWDVKNEMLHYDFYEEKLDPDASAWFFKTANEADPQATLFMNEFNVVETCSDDSSTVGTYVSKMRELNFVGVKMGGVGLQGHFDEPNPPLIRAIIDKLDTLGLPIWLTEVDISKKYSKEVQASENTQHFHEGLNDSNKQAS